MARKAKRLNFFQKIQADFENKQSYLSLILGIFIVVIVGYLLFNYFKRPDGDLLPGEQTDTLDGQQVSQDVKKENLPGKYTVKEGDTLFLIAQKYYDEGLKYPEIIKVNNIQNENLIELGQVLTIPKLKQTSFEGSLPLPDETTQVTGWGEAIRDESYIVKADDWLSKIAGRAYGDINAYDRIAKANNIIDPNFIEVGVVLKIPR
ncbi:LysM peptidoglycan-binding domain-containing protein [Candidatus Daviesbacteria bacterium]|nr:LysM peptidoglycan-binding domain-containing protein [Candidatus Daviesbacteria bacterium]